VSDEAQKLSGRISTQVTLVDYGAGTRRYGLRDDNLKNIRLVEHLKNIPRANAAVVPSDVPHEIADVVSVADIHKYSTKPGGTYIITPLGAKYIARINKLLGLRDAYLFEGISPLSFKADTIEMALMFARNGGALDIAPMATSSTTAPVSIAGTLALETAEVLGSIFLVHTMTGEYPGFAASCHTSDMRTMLCSFGSPNQALFAVAVAQLARFYGIQGGTNTALTDALAPDFQGGIEKGITAAFNSLAGLYNIGCQGIAGADQGFSFEQLVIDNEWIDYYNYILDGFDVSEESIGFDTIKSVGIAGNFLSEEHTVAFMRDNYWPSALFNRHDWSNWLVGGKKTVYDRAHEFVERVTAGYRDMEPVAPRAVCDGLDEIVREAFDECG
jgi:trimethylamine--corrinoid protein Co-methyltransferase